METLTFEQKVDAFYEYVQERCLWQFFSRTWDRHENINGILSKATDMLVGRAPVRETPIDKLHYADAKPLVSDFRERFPWLKETGEDEIRQLMDGLKVRLEDTNITKSKNRELNHHLY